MHVLMPLLFVIHVVVDFNQWAVDFSSIAFYLVFLYWLRSTHRINRFMRSFGG